MTLAVVTVRCSLDDDSPLLSLDDVCMDDDDYSLDGHGYDLVGAPMIDDFDGALEMDDDGPLMEIAYGDGPHT